MNEGPGSRWDCPLFTSTLQDKSGGSAIISGTERQRERERERKKEKEREREREREERERERKRERERERKRKRKTERDRERGGWGSNLQMGKIFKRIGKACKGKGKEDEKDNCNRWRNKGKTEGSNELIFSTTK